MPPTENNPSIFPPKARFLRWGQFAFIALFAVALVAAGGVLWTLYNRAETGEPSLGAPFALIDQNGNQVTDKDLRGQFLLVYFGYSFCPDICSTSIDKMSQAVQRLGKAGERVVPIFITLDPARDTQDILREYASHFHPRLLALRGAETDIVALAKAYRLYFRKIAGGTGGNGTGNDYLVDHSAFIYFMGPDGAYISLFGPEVDPDSMATEIARRL